MSLVVPEITVLPQDPKQQVLQWWPTVRQHEGLPLSSPLDHVSYQGGANIAGRFPSGNAEPVMLTALCVLGSIPSFPEVSNRPRSSSDTVLEAAMDCTVTQAGRLNYVRRGELSVQGFTRGSRLPRVGTEILDRVNPLQPFKKEPSYRPRRICNA